ncbi:MAG TPA: alpha/beta hydrolase family protein [Bacteroidales bacterium]|nr:alpha/beta hydrolase family protein [Bacteroidales bacterium]
MKKPFIVIIVIQLFLFTASKGQEVRILESLSMHSDILGQGIAYSICLPEGYFIEKRSYPVVYMLHGLGDDETAWLEYGRVYQTADKAVREEEIVPMIFVMPQGFRTYYMNDYSGTFLYQDMFVKELIPTIDSLYRTIPDREHRAVMGYSMGGFGALILPLKHPELMRTCVPLSISIRTDQQYITEDASGWDQQWGRIFGGEGSTGQDRITEYYRQNSPFHIFQQNDPASFNDLRIYIDNGDDEQTLCRSNEELHILMRDRGVPHEFRVRDGGHSFEYWRSSLPNALRFISDAFSNVPYRGDPSAYVDIAGLPDRQMLDLEINTVHVRAYVPAEYFITDRLYPVIYCSGNFSTGQCDSLASVSDRMINDMEIGPILLVFLPEDAVDQLSTLLPLLEEKLRIRQGYRYRSLAGFGSSASEACNIVVHKEKFRSCLLMDPYLEKDTIMNLLSLLNPDTGFNTSFFIDAPDKGMYYEGNGFLHIGLRDLTIKHEYRVREGTGGYKWSLGGFEEIIQFADYHFHK